MTSIDLNSMTAMNLDGLPTKIAVNAPSTRSGFFRKSGSFTCEQGKSADMPENFP